MAAEAVNDDVEPLERVERSRAESPRGRFVSIDNIRTLYFEDIEAIHHAFTRESDSVEMRTDEFKPRTLQRLKSIPREHFPEFHISSLRPHVSLSCTPYSYRLSSYSDDPAASRLFEDVETILRKRQNRWVGLTSSFWSSIALMVVSFGAFFLAARSGYDELGLLAMMGFYAVFLLAFSWKLFIWPKRTGVVVPLYKREVPKPWFVSDALKIALVAAAFTAVFTVVATLAVLEWQTQGGNSSTDPPALRQPSVASPEPTPTSRSRIRPNPTPSDQPSAGYWLPATTPEGQTSGSRVRPRSTQPAGGNLCPSESDVGCVRPKPTVIEETPSI